MESQDFMQYRAIASALLISLFVASTAVARPIRFAPARTFSSGITHTVRIAVGDFNRDGYPDLAISSTYNMVAIFLGNGDGTFTGPALYNLTFYVTGSVAIGDFDGDGKLDLAVVGGDVSGNGLAFLSGNGDGSFNPPKYFTTALSGASIKAIAGDFNHDNNLDLFVGGNGSSEVILGDGKGNFQDGELEDAFGFGVVAGDFNHDGNLDIAATQFYASTNPPGVAILLGNGDGTFQSPQRYSGMEEPLAIAIGDFNRDKQLDLAITDYEFNTIVILQGNGDGTFTNIGQWYAGFQPGAVAVADFNGNANVDLAASDFGGDGVFLLPGKGDGTFPAFHDVPTGAGPADVASVDLNHDGSPDLVVVNNADESVSVLLNAAGTYVQLASSPNPSNVGQAVTFTDTVQGTVTKSAMPSGTVNFKDGSTTLANVVLSQGKASFTTSALGQGTHNITVGYSGDGTFNPNRSAILVQRVN